MSDPYYDEAGFDVSYYWRVLKSAIIKSYWKVAIFAVFSAVLAYLFSLSLTPVYKASAILHVAPNNTAVFDLRELLLSRRDPAFQQTQVGIIRSRSVLQEVAVRNDLHKTLLQTSVEVVPVRSSYLIDITTTLSDPALAARISNSVSEVYIEQTISAERKSAAREEEWLLERLETVRIDLQNAERALQDFKENQNIIGTSRESNSFANQEIQRLSERLIGVREKRLELEVIYQQITEIEASGADLQTVSIVENNSLIQTIRNELLQLEQRKSELSGRYGPEHRRMIELDAEINAANENLVKQTDRVITSLKAEYDLASQNETFFSESLDSSTSKVQDLGRNQFDLLELEQRVNTQREIYMAFLERLNQSRATGDNQNSDIRLADPATPPLSPESSKGLKLIIIAVFLSILAGFGLAVLVELFDNTVMSSNDIAKKLGFTSLGQIPKITELSATEDNPNIAHQYFSENKQSPFAEAVRTLRSSIMLSSLGQDKLRVMFTSTQPSEGKTSLAISTAAAFGQIKKTLLIDGDLRRPSVLGAITGDAHMKSMGISDLCIGLASEEDCIQHVKKFGIDVLTSGTLSPNPQELFCSADFTQVLNRLSEKYEVIIIDSPPCGGLSDSHLLASQVDDLIYVVKAGTAPVNRIRATLQSLQQINAPIKGIVLNQADTSIAGYEYGYYGAYGTYGSELREPDSQVKA